MRGIERRKRRRDRGRGLRGDPREALGRSREAPARPHEEESYSDASGVEDMDENLDSGSEAGLDAPRWMPIERWRILH